MPSAAVYCACSRAACTSTSAARAACIEQHKYNRIRTRHVLVSAKNETSRVGPGARRLLLACTIHRLKPVLSMCPQLYSGCLGNSKKGTRPSIGGQEAMAGSPHWSVFSSSSMWDERPALIRMPDACRARPAVIGGQNAMA